MRFHAPVSGDKTLGLPGVFAHYLPWYTLRGSDFPLADDLAATVKHPPVMEDFRHWQDKRAEYRRTHLHLPEIGIYDSRDPAVVEWQIGRAREYGIDGFIVNWYGMNSVENVITLHWRKALAAWNGSHPDQPFYWFVSFDSQAQRATEGKVPAGMAEDFAYIRDHLIDDAYLRRDGRPVFALFPYEENAAAWRSAADSVFGAAGADLLWMNGLPRGVEGAYPWVRPDETQQAAGSAHSWHNPDSPGVEWLRSFYDGVNRAGGAQYLMGGVWPGFNDQLVSWGWSSRPDDPTIRPRVICRESTAGSTLELTWLAYLEYLKRSLVDTTLVPAPLVQIVTWNDYAEASTVEPARDYGFAPLELCRKYVEQARALWRTA